MKEHSRYGKQTAPFSKGTGTQASVRKKDKTCLQQGAVPDCKTDEAVYCPGFGIAG